MGFTRRAILYVTQKKGKSALLFLILLVIATFVLTGLSIQKATQTTQENLRYALGGEFKVVPDLTENNPHYKMETDNDGNFSVYTELPITLDLIDTVLKTDGIKSFSAESLCLVSTGLEVIPGNVPVKAEYRDRVYARFVTGTENSSYFQDGPLRLLEGRHVPPEGGHVAVISNELAEKNGLRIGDTLYLSTEGVNLEKNGSTNLKIIGLFKVDKQVQAFSSVTSFDRLENQIFSGLEAYQELLPNLTAGYNSAVFRVYDPAQLDEIVSRLEKNNAIDWRAFNVETNNKTYQDATAPLQRFQSLITIILILIVIVSAVVLSLILTMWVKNRIHETGILLSLGIRKSAIIGQYLAEVLLIAVFAFGFSFITSSIIGSHIGNGLLQTQVQSRSTETEPEGGYENGLQIMMKEQGDNNDFVVNDKGNGGEPVKDTPAPESLTVSIGLDSVINLFLIGFAIIALSVVISSVSVLRLQPRALLSKMS